MPLQPWQLVPADVLALLDALNGGGPQALSAAAKLTGFCHNPDPGLSTKYVGPWLIKCTDQGYEPPLAAMKSPDVLVRQVAAEAIAALKRGTTTVSPVLVTALEDSDGVVRSWSLQALRYHGPDAAPAVPVLRKILANPGPDRWQAISALGSIGPVAKPCSSSTDRDLSGRAHEEEAVRASVLTSLVLIDARNPETHEIVRAASGSASPFVRTDALLALTRNYPDEALPRLSSRRGRTQIRWSGKPRRRSQAN